MLIPEIVLYKTVTAFIAALKKDYDDASDKNKTILADIFKVDDNGNEMSFTYKDDLFKAAVKTFITNDDKVDTLKVFIGYNRERAEVGAPNVHIILPSENKGRMDTLGNSAHNTTDGTDVFIDKSKSKIAVYHLMITSNNIEQVIATYYMLQALFLIFDFHCEQAGMRNLKISGADINFQSDISQNVYHRNCTIEFDYEYHIKTRIPQAVINGYNFGFCADLAEDNNNPT